MSSSRGELSFESGRSLSDSDSEQAYNAQNRFIEVVSCTSSAKECPASHLLEESSHRVWISAHPAPQSIVLRAQLPRQVWCAQRITISYPNKSNPDDNRILWMELLAVLSH
jgi:hypothetical protein